MASKVTVQRTSLVSPDEHRVQNREHSAGRGILLPVFSQVLWFIPYRTRFLFFECPPAELHTFDSLVSKLKNSLAEALVHFYPLAGRLNLREDGLMEVLCNDQGVLFIEASAQVSLRELQKNDLNGHFQGIPVGLLQDMAQACGHTLRWPWPSDAPLFIIQVTKLSCGGICLSIQFSHQLLDGTGTWHFVKSWAELSRGESISLQPLVLETPPPVASSFDKQQELPSGYVRHKKPDLLRRFATSPDTSTECEMKCFCFKKEMISRMKEDNPGFTSFQLLTSHIWSRATTARKLPESDTTTMLFAINCRERVEWLPRGFVGEAAFAAGASTRVGELRVGSGAALLRNTIEEFSGKVSELYNLLGGWPDKEHALLNKINPANDLIVGSSFYFPVFQDFGFGKAVGMTIVPVCEDGKVYYFPAREEGDVVAYISLKSHAMRNLQLY